MAQPCPRSGGRPPHEDPDADFAGFYGTHRVPSSKSRIFVNPDEKPAFRLSGRPRAMIRLIILYQNQKRVFFAIFVGRADF